MGRDTYDIAQSLVKRIRGGLGMATVVANAIFAAITGVSIASATVFTRISVPEMLRYGYKGRFAVGVVAGSSVLGMLIPPSVLLIIYALIAGNQRFDRSWSDAAFTNCPNLEILIRRVISDDETGASFIILPHMQRADPSSMRSIIIASSSLTSTWLVHAID